MLFYRRVFQNFDSINRLRWHHLFHISQHPIDRMDRRACSINITSNACHQIVRMKSDIVASSKNHQIQHFDIEPIEEMSQTKLIASNNKPLPFEAIPCADQLNAISDRFTGIMTFLYQWKQLLTSKWDNQFHNDIDKCHHQFGPIFRKYGGERFK